MEMQLWCLGKSDPGFIDEAIDLYSKRLKHYVRFGVEIFKLSKKQRHDPEQEASFIIGKLTNRDHLILLDENGKLFRSVEFADKVNQWLVGSNSRVIFLIGGAHGFSDKLYARANGKISMSPMTFSHQVIRILFLEQLYRAFTIIHNEPYHNE